MKFFSHIDSFREERGLHKHIWRAVCLRPLLQSMQYFFLTL